MLWSSRGDEGLVVRVETPREQVCCPCCGSRDVRLQGAKTRRVQAQPLGDTPVWLSVRARRMECRSCGRHPMERFDFVAPRARHTRELLAQGVRDCRVMTIKEAAARAGLSWHTLHGGLERELEAEVAGQDLSGLRLLAVDELHVCHGVYMTVVLDLETHEVVHVARDRNAEALSGFFAEAARQGARIEAVAMDMSAAYRSAVSSLCPEATVVLDRFHLVQRANQALDSLRRSLWRQEGGKAGDEALRRDLGAVRHVLLRSEGDTTPGPLGEALRGVLGRFPALARGFEALRSFRTAVCLTDLSAAEAAFDACLELVRGVGARCFDALGRTLARCREGVLAFCKYQITTGPLEGKNNRFRSLLRRGYGYRNLDFVRLLFFSTNRGYT